MSNSLSKSSGRVLVSQFCAQNIVKLYSIQDLGWLLQSFIFFIFFFLYIWLYVDPRLIYHGAGIITNFPVFYKSWTFFLTFLSYPGGPLEYLSAFLSQLFYYSWAGALVITVQAWLLSVCADYLLKTTNSPPPQLRLAKLNGGGWLCFILPIILLILYTRYAYHFATTMAFLTALLITCLYLKMTLSQTTILGRRGAGTFFGDLSTFLCLSVILYYLAGGAFQLFAVICAIYELIFRSRWKMGLFYLLSAAVIPYVVGLLIFRISIIDAFCNLLPYSWKILYYETRRRGVTIVYLLYLLPPLTLIVFGLWQILRKRIIFVKSQNNKEPKKKHRNRFSNLIAKIFSWYRHSRKLRWIIGLLLLFAIAGGAVFFSHDDNLKTRFEVDYYAYHKMWPELLISARRNPTSAFVVHAVDRALYHTGRLGYDMFSWPQNPDYLFLTDPGYKWIYWESADVYLDIGLINIAENAFTECLEGYGDRPMVLQRLALINMVKGNIDSARVYLGALSKTLFHADWARDYLARLRSDPNLSTDNRIQFLRSISLEKDLPPVSIPQENLLSSLLEKNSQNRMAFEYLMALYLLKKHLSMFILNIDRLKDFGYLELPRHYQEAALVYAAGTGKRVYLRGYKMSPLLRKQVEDFSQILHSYGTNKRAAYNEVVRKYRDSYFFYYMYAPSGAKR